MKEEVKDRDGQIIAYVVRRPCPANGQEARNFCEFYTAAKDELQLAWMRRERGHVVQPHDHRPGPRLIKNTSEVLVVMSGCIRVTFYGSVGSDGWELDVRQLEPGDVAVLLQGGHSVEVVETAEIVEIKQGPFCNDKVLIKRDRV